ncbi:MAG: hypothetical protein ACNA77_04415 [Opitutales bacterium]
MKEKSEQSLLFVFIYALMMVWMGGLLGFMTLFSFPLKAYANEEDHAKALEARESSHAIPGDAFYIEGPVARSPSWESKRQQLIDATVPEVRISVGEVNAWLEAKFRVGTPSAGEEGAGLVLRPERPNMGLSRAGTIYLNLPAKISGYGLDGAYVLSARVSYKEGSPASLIVDHLQIAGAAVPLPRIIGAKLVSALINGFSSADEYAVLREAWSRVQSVETTDSTFILTLKRP